MSDQPATSSQVQSSIDAVKELMSAHFKTVQVQLEGLAKIGPDVEDLKRDLSLIKTELAERGARVTQIEEELDNLDREFMSRQDLLATFVTRKEAQENKHWTRNNITLGLTIVSITVAIALGLINAL